MRGAKRNDSLMPDQADRNLAPKAPMNHSVVLPCAPDEFAEFIGDLLGKPQVIRRAIPGAFDIQFADIESLYHLIQHRLAEQNNARLLQFSATFSYSDQSSVLINGFDEFRRYSEVKNVETVNLTCSFDYLIQFTNRSHPERQTIDVSFNNGVRGLLDEDDSLPFYVFGPRSVSARSVIFLRIKHTARSWGADLESLLAEHLKGLIRVEAPVKRFLRKHNSALGLPFGLIVLLGGFFAAASLSTYLNGARTAEAVRVLKSIHDAGSASYLGIPVLISQQLDQAAPWSPVLRIIIILTSSVLAILAWVFVSGELDSPYPSFLTFTKADESRRAPLLKRQQRSIWLAFGTAAASVAYSIIANYLSPLLAAMFGGR